MANNEPRILAFLCNWCSYAGADLAGTSRIQYPSILRILQTSDFPFPGGRGLRGRGQIESKLRLRKQACKRYPLSLALRAFPLHRGGGNTASSLRLNVSTSSAKEWNTLGSRYPLPWWTRGNLVPSFLGKE